MGIIEKDLLYTITILQIIILIILNIITLRKIRFFKVKLKETLNTFHDLRRTKNKN